MPGNDDLKGINVKYRYEFTDTLGPVSYTHLVRQKNEQLDIQAGDWVSGASQGFNNWLDDTKAVSYTHLRCAMKLDWHGVFHQ